jgi:hypothetical protein
LVSPRRELLLAHCVDLIQQRCQHRVVPQAPSAVASSEHVEGVARRVRIDNEGAGCVLRFVVETDEGGLVPVEMRGREVLGVLDDGDRVRFDRAPSAAGTARPRRVANLSTNAEVEVPVPGRLDRWSGVVGLRDVRTALISALVTATVGAFTNAFESGEPTSAQPNSGKRPEPSHALWWVLAAAIVIALVCLTLLWGRRRPQLFRSTLAIAIGCSVGLLALYLLD